MSQTKSTHLLFNGAFSTGPATCKTASHDSPVNFKLIQIIVEH